MCKASQEAEHTIDAKEGETYGVDISTGGIGSLHRPGETSAQCVVCVKDGQTITLANIPEELQEAHGIGAQEEAEFIQTEHNYQDMVRFENGVTIPLSDFAHKDVSAFAGTMAQFLQAQAAGIVLVAVTRRGDGHVAANG